MRWKIWANPGPNEGLIHAVKICQLPVNSSSGPARRGGRLCEQGLWACTQGVVFLPFPCFFVFLECGYKLYGGAWSLFTLGANSPQLNAEVRRKTGQGAAQKAAQPGGAVRGQWRARQAVEGYLILNLLFFF